MMPFHRAKSSTSCLAEGPVGAKAADGSEPRIYVIVAALCTECVGHHEVSQCVEVCPVDCIVLNPEIAETKEQLYEKYLSLSGQPAPQG